MNDARQWFDSVDASRRRFEMLRDRVMERRALLDSVRSSDPSATRVARGSSADRVADDAAALIDLEAADRAEMERCAHRIRQARAVVRGVEKAMGPTFAEPLGLRYLCGESYRNIADATGCSPATALRRAQCALDYCESVGLSAAARGERA